MPKSKHRKNQKKKAQQRTHNINAAKKKQMEEYLKKLEDGQSPPVTETPYNPNQMKNPYSLGR